MLSTYCVRLDIVQGYHFFWKRGNIEKFGNSKVVMKMSGKMQTVGESPGISVVWRECFVTQPF